MGRSRAVPNLVEEDPTQRSKRKKTDPHVENLDTATAGLVSHEGKKALYHCNYCNKDISGKIRFKCAICSNLDLCVECFSVGAEVHPHRGNHAYRVMDNLEFPLICPDWNADEELLLLEGIEMYGFGNWTEVAEHVGTKSRSQCIDHYNAIYMNSPCFPLPDLSHVMGKNREELLAMAREHESSKGLPSLEEVTVKEESPLSSGIKVEDQRKGPAEPTLRLSAGIGKKALSIAQTKDGHDEIKLEDRSTGEKKLSIAGDEGPCVVELRGYNSKRQEFDIEYDNDAEQLLADMEFKETDTDGEREIKLRILRIYSNRLNERKRRKDFTLERNLLYPDPFEKDLSLEERDICRRYRVFMRFHSQVEHEEFLKSVIEERRILKIIQDLQDARSAGCRTTAEAERHFQQKRQAEDSAHRVTDNIQAGPSGKFLERANHLKEEQDCSLQGVNHFRDHAVANVLDKWDVTGFMGAELLSEAEKHLCDEMRILPTHYLKMLETMSLGIISGKITKKSDAHVLFNVDPTKVDKVYDVLIEKGVTQN